jgi:hypothetical protein
MEWCSILAENCAGNEFEDIVNALPGARASLPAAVATIAMLLEG